MAGLLPGLHPLATPLGHPLLTKPALRQALLYVMCVHAQSFSCVRLSVTLWTVARQAPLSIGFSRQEYWSGLSRPLFSRGSSQPSDQTMSLTLPVLAGEFSRMSAIWVSLYHIPCLPLCPQQH